MNRIDLTNFRVFAAAASFDLAPVTILTGRNNSGKSSLVKAFLVLADFLEARDQTAMALNGPRAAKHKIHTYANLENWAQQELEEGFVRLGFVTKGYEVKFLFDEHDDATKANLWRVGIYPPGGGELTLEKTNGSYELETTFSCLQQITSISNDSLSFGPKQQQELTAVEEKLTELEESIRYRRDRSLSIEPETLAEQQRYQQRGQQLRHRRARAKKYDNFEVSASVSAGATEGGLTTIPRLIQAAVSNFINHERSTNQYLLDEYAPGAIHLSGVLRLADEELAVLHQAIAPSLEQLFRVMPYHLGPNRAPQHRLYVPYAMGSELSTIVSALPETGFARYGTADRYLSHWLTRFGIGEAVTIKWVEGTAFQLLVRQGKQEVNLADLGFGTGQLLVILLQIAAILQARDYQRALAETDDLLPNQHLDFAEALVLIEEPEANLHPQFQSRLAELFVETASQYGVQFILETHSEYLLRKVQALVKEGEKLADFKVYYLNEGPGAEKPTYEMRLLPDGRFQDEFGTGFLDESKKLAFQLL